MPFSKNTTTNYLIRIKKARLLPSFFLIHAVVFRDFPYHTAGIARRKYVRRNIPRYHTSRADYRIFPYRYTAANGNTRRQPNTAFYHDRLGVFDIVRRSVLFEVNFAFLNQKRVNRRNKLAIRPDKHVVAQANGRAVQHRQIEIRITIFARCEIHAVIKLYRPLDIRTFSQIRAKLFQNCRRLLIKP